VEALWSRVRDGIRSDPRQRPFWTLPQWRLPDWEGPRLGCIPAAFASAGATAAIAAAIVFAVVLIDGGMAEARFFQRVAELEAISQAAVQDDVLTVDEVAAIEARVAAVVEALDQDRDRLADAPAMELREALATVAAVQALLTKSIDEQVSRPPAQPDAGTGADAASPQRLRDFATVTDPALTDVATDVQRVVDENSNERETSVVDDQSEGPRETKNQTRPEEEPDATGSSDAPRETDEANRDEPGTRDGDDPQSTEPIRTDEKTDAEIDEPTDPEPISDAPVRDGSTLDGSTDREPLRETRDTDAAAEEPEPEPTRATDTSNADEPVATDQPTRRLDSTAGPAPSITDSLATDSSSTSSTACTERDSTSCLTR